MKKILFVNSNMKIGGVQKSLCNLLWEISDRYEITLLLFESRGAYLEKLPPNVRVITPGGPCRFLGASQGEYRKTSPLYWGRGFFALLTKALGRPVAMSMAMLPMQKTVPGEYDCAISFLHNEDTHAFYGGTNEFVLNKVRAKRKIAFLHCDYEICGANAPENNRLYDRFDTIAACSRVSPSTSA